MVAWILDHEKKNCTTIHIFIVAMTGQEKQRWALILSCFDTTESSLLELPLNKVLSDEDKYLIEGPIVGNDCSVRWNIELTGGFSMECNARERTITRNQKLELFISLVKEQISALKHHQLFDVNLICESRLLGRKKLVVFDMVSN